MPHRFRDTERRNKHRKENYARGRPERQDSCKIPFTEREKELILARTISDRELAVMINRSVQSIQIKRVRLMKELRNGKDILR